MTSFTDDKYNEKMSSFFHPLPILGFDINRKVTAYIGPHDFHVIEYTHELLAFAVTSPREAFKIDNS